MLRSGKLPYEAVRELTRNRASSHTVYRPDDSVSGWGEQSDSFSTRTVDIDLTSNTSAHEQKRAGVDSTRTTSGRVLDSADIEEHDLIVYRGVAMEVVSKTPHPTGENTQFELVAFRERTDVDTANLP